MSLDNLEVEKRKGGHAKRLLEDELLNEILDTMEKQTIELWESTPARDSEGREHLHRFYLACRKFRNELRNVLDTGKMAEQQISTFERVKNLVGWH